MKRRQAPTEWAWPTKLLKFTAHQWTGRDDAERYRAWMTARRNYAESTGLESPPGDAAAWAAFPDGEFRYDEI